MFKDRKEAGKLLGDMLAAYRGKNAVVLALPRGGVVLGAEIAKALALPLDIVVVRKIGHPDNHEYAICAVDEQGARICNESAIRDIDTIWLAKETKRQMAEALRRVRVYRGTRLPVRLAGTTAIIVDDGIATGLTMRSAIAFVRARKARKVIVAVPVSSEDSIRDISKYVDDVVLLEPSEGFLGAVGLHYQKFDQVSDEEVVRLVRPVTT